MFSEATYVQIINLCYSPEKGVVPRRLPTQGKVRRSWFNTSGTWAYAWSVMHGKHYIKAWNVQNTDISTQIIHSIVGYSPSADHNKG